MKSLILSLAASLALFAAPTLAPPETAAGAASMERTPPSTLLRL